MTKQFAPFGLALSALVLPGAANAATSLPSFTLPALFDDVQAPGLVLVLVVIWMANATLAVLSGKREQQMLLLGMSLAVLASTMGTPVGWGMLAIGLAAALALLPMKLRRDAADEPRQD
ncbi:hypothetical protein [uncultured Jannaschia sp.]|uniref:hypothetical protein n=1 Tax=uncultured Jannaschia sp. TaxID=293347 RepID=UPI002610B3E3|nr:hypothetical protein [uncultured Jannaschia sp.]